MTRTNGLVALVVAASLSSVSVGSATAHDEPERFGGPAALQGRADATGIMATYSATGKIDARGAFFQPLGINGRTCATCHALDQAMSVAVPQIQATFARTQGRDPLFAAVDGANCPTVR